MELLEKSRNFRYVIAILEISHFEFEWNFIGLYLRCNFEGYYAISWSERECPEIVLSVFSFFVEMKRTFRDKFN